MGAIRGVGFGGQWRHGSTAEVETIGTLPFHRPCSALIADSIHSPGNGFWFRRIAPRVPGKVRWRPPGAESAATYDPDCYLCPGNSRAGGVRNPEYDSTFVFDNDFAALQPDAPIERVERDGLLIAESEPGVCRVVCFSPRHDLTIRQHGRRRICARWWMCGWRSFEELGARPGIDYVQIFENRGAMMGASNPHPHGQIWAQPFSAERDREGTGVRLRLGARSAAIACFASTRSWNARPADAWWRRTAAFWRWCRIGRCGRSRR